MGGMRLSRPCYDKPRRCPGWAGGGMKYANVKHCTSEDDSYNGYITWHKGFALWRFGRCNSCDTVTWPFMIQWIDPGFWKYKLHWWFVLRYWRHDLRDWWGMKMWRIRNRHARKR
jgi:hypothetical protein